jgi:hypothetical protein
MNRSSPGLVRARASEADRAAAEELFIGAKLSALLLFVPALLSNASLL